MSITWRAVALAALGLVPVLLLPQMATVGTWLLIWLALVILDAALAASPAKVAITRGRLPAVRLTEPATSTLTLVNTGGRRLRGVVRDAWQPTAGAERNRHPLDIQPGEARRVSTPLLPVRRGDLLPHRVTLRTLGPLGIAGRQRSIPVPGTLRVLPEFSSRRHLPSRLARLREMDGRSAVNVRGPGTEFDSLREYVMGDDVRAIDWRATARRQEMVVRTWRPERDRRVLIVLDTARLSAARLGDAPRLDAGIEAALLLTALATRAGDRVELVAVDREVRARVSGTHASAVMSTMAAAVAPVHPRLVEPDWTLVAQLVRDRLSQRALVVLVTAVEASSVETGLVQVAATLAGDHQVVVASATDPEAEALRRGRETSADLFDAAAAERAGLERRAVTVELRRAGVEVVERLPDDLAPALADTYLALKAAGRL
ncbi:DUF58 domain-containing protein [Pseudactinotalea suaedae]|uniref:DUF58 domain-containing protein n=1 Tax=Pseudactinotalea suaedae TaxID=1524924 RepID=UPI0012E24BFF|nr:DUF58 domain-containing protein [Pseudactinotalea suaedae]